MRRTATGLAAVLALFLLRPAHAPSELIDRILAAVNNDVITLTDLQQATAFNKALGGRGNGGQTEAGTLEGLVNRKLLLQEAARVKFDEVPDQDVDAALAALRRRLGSDEAYRRLLAGMQTSEDELRRMLREQLLVERFLEKKIGIFARATHDEVQKYYTGHPQEFAGRPFPAVQKELTVFLSQQKAGQQLDQLIAELRSRANIRINRLQEEERKNGISRQE